MSSRFYIEFKYFIRSTEEEKNESATINLRSRFNRTIRLESNCESCYLILYQFHIKDKRCVRRDDSACPPFPVSHAGPADKLGFPTEFHQGDAFVPPLDEPLLFLQ